MLRQVEGSKRLLSCLDVLAAIVRQGGSFASDRLTAHGLTAQVATDLADTHYAATGREAEAGLRQTKEKLEALRGQQSQQLKFVSGTTQAKGGTPDVSLADYRITVVSRDPVDEVQFKGAISADGSLSLLVETTPFEFRFIASEIIAVVEAVTGREGISVKLLALQSDGTEKKVGGFGGESGALLENQRDLSGLWKSGYLR